MNISDMQQLIAQITYKPGWSLSLHVDAGDRPYLQIEATTLDSCTLQPTTWRSGKTYLSVFMCRQEIVSAVYGAIEKAELHEIREFFRYKGASIFNPHLDPDVLAQVARKWSNFNVRDNAMTMIELNWST